MLWKLRLSIWDLITVAFFGSSVDGALDTPHHTCIDEMARECYVIWVFWGYASNGWNLGGSVTHGKMWNTEGTRVSSQHKRLSLFLSKKEARISVEMRGKCRKRILFYFTSVYLPVCPQSEIFLNLLSWNVPSGWELSTSGRAEYWRQSLKAFGTVTSCQNMCNWDKLEADGFSPKTHQFWTLVVLFWNI